MDELEPPAASKPSDVPPDSARHSNSSTLRGRVSAVIGLVVGAFGALLLWKASDGLAPRVDDLVCFSPALIAPVVVLGVQLNLTGRLEAKAQGLPSDPVSRLAIPLMVLGSVLYLMGWLAFAYGIVHRAFSY